MSKILSWLVEWKKRNPEKVREQKRRYREKHAAEIKDYRNSEKGKALRKAAKKRFRENHAEQIKEEKRRYVAKNPDVRLAWNRNRRARIKGNGGKITKTEWRTVLDKYGHKCLYPGCERTDVTMDHVVPLSQGGTHSADNVQPLCEYHNKSKYNEIRDYR